MPLGHIILVMKITPLLYHYVTAHNGKGDINARYNKYSMHFGFFSLQEITFFNFQKQYREQLEIPLSCEAEKKLCYFRYRIPVTFERKILKIDCNHTKSILKACTLILKLQMHL